MPVLGTMKVPAPHAKNGSEIPRRPPTLENRRPRDQLLERIRRCRTGQRTRKPPARESIAEPPPLRRADWHRILVRALPPLVKGRDLFAPQTRTHLKLPDFSR